VEALARVHARLQHAGIDVLVIVPNRQDAAKRYVEEVGTPFHLLCDDGDVMRRYGVRRWLRPRPALFGVDAGGVIRVRHAGDWDVDTPALAGVIEGLSRATSQPPGAC
jgi:peroxiredoxin